MRRGVERRPTMRVERRRTMKIERRRRPKKRKIDAARWSVAPTATRLTYGLPFLKKSVD